MLQCITWSTLLVSASLMLATTIALQRHLKDESYQECVMDRTTSELIPALEKFENDTVSGTQQHVASFFQLIRSDLENTPGYSILIEPALNNTETLLTDGISTIVANVSTPFNEQIADQIYSIEIAQARFVSDLQVVFSVLGITLTLASGALLCCVSRIVRVIIVYVCAFKITVSTTILLIQIVESVVVRAESLTLCTPRWAAPLMFSAALLKVFGTSAFLFSIEG